MSPGLAYLLGLATLPTAFAAIFVLELVLDFARRVRKNASTLEVQRGAIQEQRAELRRVRAQLAVARHVLRDVQSQATRAATREERRH